MMEKQITDAVRRIRNLIEVVNTQRKLGIISEKEYVDSMDYIEHMLRVAEEEVWNGTH